MIKRRTIADVAAAAGVSVATVSKAVNGRYGVAPETAARVLKAAEELGYGSSLGASSLRGGRTGVIGVFVAAFEPWATEVLKGVYVGMQATQYDLLAYSGSYNEDHDGWERRSLARLSGTLVDGAIVVAPSTTDLRVTVPVVAIDPSKGPAGLPVVEADSFGGARMAVRRLIELGHRRIGLVSGRADLRSAALRETGYRRALDDAGIPFDPALVRVGAYEQRASREAAGALLDLPEPPTAIFAANDLSALATLQVARLRGVDVPDSLSVIGFDDVPEAARSDPPLTTVQQSMQRMGAAAAAMLLDLLDGRDPQERHQVLGTRLVERATTAPPPGLLRRAT
ncbi:LacI family DNA-binding transcriptional regulator [Amnibacterium endophyticum]|uniref:LacI family DNA-binding transcriptional regulator n=1 Tax=Amnibacterium endophyticum TaxID=2109337 RepID=A0ABW4LHV2_9MICO